LDYFQKNIDGRVESFSGLALLTIRRLNSQLFSLENLSPENWPHFTKNP
jgi:hypothetical protein